MPALQRIRHGVAVCNSRAGDRRSVIIMKKFVFILLALPVVIVVLLLLTKMRWKFSKPASQRVGAPEMIVAGHNTTSAPSHPGNFPLAQPMALVKRPA